jgi:hypothetical protein
LQPWEFPLGNAIGLGRQKLAIAFGVLFFIVGPIITALRKRKASCGAEALLGMVWLGETAFTTAAARRGRGIPREECWYNGISGLSHCRGWDLDWVTIPTGLNYSGYIVIL